MQVALDMSEIVARRIQAWDGRKVSSLSEVKPSDRCVHVRVGEGTAAQSTVYAFASSSYANTAAQEISNAFGAKCLAAYIESFSGSLSEKLAECLGQPQTKLSA